MLIQEEVAEVVQVMNTIGKMTTNKGVVVRRDYDII
jgi:hypothetical protein